MKIIDRTNVQDPRLGGGPAPVDQPASRASEETGEATTGDRVQVSDTARRLAALVASTPDDPTRQARIEALRAAVEDRTYQADLEGTARKFLVDVASEPRSRE
ncbi:MAG: flagellar biosynthesis anti-sigma factor FlgM [Candidatus Binatia bacterium]